MISIRRSFIFYVPFLLFLSYHSCKKTDPIPYKEMIAGHWNHDSTLTDTYTNGAFYDRWSEVYSIRFIRFEEGLLRYMFIQDDVEYVSNSYHYDIEGSSIKIWPYSGHPEGKLLPIMTLTDINLVYKDSYSPSGTTLPTTIEEIYYLSRE